MRSGELWNVTWKFLAIRVPGVCGCMLEVSRSHVETRFIDCSNTDEKAKRVPKQLNAWDILQETDLYMRNLKVSRCRSRFMTS